MCACFRRHVPSDADVVFVEYAVNDDEHKAPAFNNNVRCAGRRRGMMRGWLAAERRRARSHTICCGLTKRLASLSNSILARKHSVQRARMATGAPSSACCASCS